MRLPGFSGFCTVILALAAAPFLGCAGAGEAEGEHTGRPSIPSAAELAKLPEDGGPKWNRLVFEKSPYLLQHAGNPVDWYPWGEAAFAKARAEDKPVFLSIGYSTCHWCHVMERESFESDSIAAIMNEHYVCIKVDLEERPDIDNVYMAAVMVSQGRGGWPLSAFLTADGKPFFTGTYFPPEDNLGRPGFATILGRIHDAWTTDRPSLLARGSEIADRLRASTSRRPGADLGTETLAGAAEAFAGRFDRTHGGFGDAPKFPAPHNLVFLLRYHARTGDGESLAIAEKTLEKMALGGIADHLGGGFHRYSTDRQWLVPHFEKMLYDQAMLGIAYVEAYRATGEERYADTARAIFRYVLRDMTHEKGGFFSAEDADSEGEEGKFYVWRPEEVTAVLGQKRGALFNEIYDVTARGNFEKGASILHLRNPLDEIAADRGEDPAAFAREMEEAREELRKARSKRVPPLRDDKILTGWNALMISALARAAQTLGDDEYRIAAEKGAAFIREDIKDGKGRLLRRYRLGEGAIPAYIDDYAFYLQALVDLYEATFDPAYLSEAADLAKTMMDLFWDDTGQGFFFQAEDGEELIVRTKEAYDGAIPSGNSAAALALLRLGDLTGDPEMSRRGRAVIDAFSGDITRAPAGYAWMLGALDFAVGPTVEIVVAGDPGRPDTEAMIRAVRERYLPNGVLLLRPGGAGGDSLANPAPFLAEQDPMNGRAAAYVCRNHACSLPTNDVAELVRMIEEG
ncbi:MAG: thioredoxin domain-containing protein [Candidatus Eisenbacteria bacterium]